VEGLLKLIVADISWPVASSSESLCHGFSSKPCETSQSSASSVGHLGGVSHRDHLLSFWIRGCSEGERVNYAPFLHGEPAKRREKENSIGIC